MASDIIKDNITYRNLYKEYIDFAAKRTERLTSALYLVSDLIPEKEPLKTLLREKGLMVMSDIFSLAVFGKEDREDVFFKIMTGISELVALLRIASVSYIISEMNSGILQKEYASLHNFFESQSRDSGKQILGKEIILNDNFFEGKEWARLNGIIGRYDKGHDKRHKINKGHGDDLYDQNSKQQTDDSVKSKIQIPERMTEETKGNHNENYIQEERKKTIVQLIKDSNGNASIKDISFHVKGCSEKTLQRDIISLMQKGVLKKIGERRWSRYSLI